MEGQGESRKMGGFFSPLWELQLFPTEDLSAAHGCPLPWFPTLCQPSTLGCSLDLAQGLQPEGHGPRERSSRSRSCTQTSYWCQREGVLPAGVPVKVYCGKGLWAGGPWHFQNKERRQSRGKAPYDHPQMPVFILRFCVNLASCP